MSCGAKGFAPACLFAEFSPRSGVPAAVIHERCVWVWVAGWVFCSSQISLVPHGFPCVCIFPVQLSSISLAHTQRSNIVLGNMISTLLSPGTVFHFGSVIFVALALKCCYVAAYSLFLAHILKTSELPDHRHCWLIQSNKVKWRSHTHPSCVLDYHRLMPRTHILILF